MPMIPLRAQRRALVGGAAQRALFLNGTRIWQRPGVTVPGDGAVPLRTPTPKTAFQVHSGHSLTDAVLRNGVFNDLSEAGGMTEAWRRIRKSTIPGSSTVVRWNAAPGTVSEIHARYDIADYDLLSITEGGFLMMPYTDVEIVETELRAQMETLTNFIRNARENGAGGAGAQCLLYTIWPAIDDTGPDVNQRRDPRCPTTFREQIDYTEAGWHYRQEIITRDLGGYLHIVPGHRLMARIWDDVQAGLVPGVSTMPDLFIDYIHPNEIGNYALACLHYAVIYGESPVGLPGSAAVTAAQATYFQTIAWEIATSYARSGLGGTDMGAAGLMPVPALQHPAETLGDRARLVLTGRDPATTERQGVTPATIGGLVGSVTSGTTVLRAHSDAQRPALRDGYLEFVGAPVMIGDLAVSGPRYIARLVRTGDTLSSPFDTQVSLQNNGQRWQGDYQWINEMGNGFFSELFPGPGSIGQNYPRHEWHFVEVYFDANERRSRIRNHAPLQIQPGPHTLPSTSKIVLNGVVDTGSLINSPTFVQQGQFDLAGLVIASAWPTDEESRSIEHFLRTRLAAPA